MSHKFGGAVYAERNFGRFPASENVISAPASPILSLMMNEIVKIRKEHWDRINKENSRLSCEAKRAHESGFYAGWDWGTIDDLPIDGETIEKHWQEFVLEEREQ